MEIQLNHKKSKSENNVSYKLITWNLLCKSLCDDFCCPQLDPIYRDWTHRRKLFSEIFFKSNADIDIYCFQEVESHQDILELLNENSSDFEGIHYEKNLRPQGISLFYRKNLFKLNHHFRYELKDSDSKIGANFVMVAFLEDNFKNNFCILNTHLKAFDEFESVRIHQIDSILHLLNKHRSFLNNFKKFKCSSVILSGDFNASPDFQCVENVRNFKFKEKILDNFIPVFNYFDREKEDYEEFSLCIYKGELIKKAIDYIFHTKRIEIIYKSIEDKSIDLSNGLPSPNFPSDHLFLKIEFRFI